MRRPAIGARTGPIGRLVRGAWLVIVVVTAASLIDARGPARFRNPHVLSEPTAWLVHFVAVLMFALLVGSLTARPSEQLSRRGVTAALASVGLIVATAGAIGMLTADSFWGYPLADLVWIFDVGVLCLEAVAFALAIGLGTPGCEVGVWRELRGRLRGDTAATTVGLACVVGIHFVDRWEQARRR